MDRRFIGREVTYIPLNQKGFIEEIEENEFSVIFGKQERLFTFPDAFFEKRLGTTEPDLLAYLSRVRSGNTSSSFGEVNYFGEKPLFLNIAWMKRYDDIAEDDIPINGGSFVNENKDANEVYNYTPVKIRGGKDDDWRVLGSFETKTTKIVRNQARIERIADCANLINENYAENVLVIWCATPKTGKPRVVGWYKNATVHRHYLNTEIADTYSQSWTRGYNVSAMAKDAVLLPEKERLKDKWLAARHTKNSEHQFGFGQANVWYASEPAAHKYVKELIGHIKAYRGPGLLDVYFKPVSPPGFRSGIIGFIKRILSLFQGSSRPAS